jgi:glycosyltransferase involved in cell wall biosynthesis
MPVPDTRPTVLHVLEAFAGGTERHLIDLVRNLDSFQHVIVVPAEHHGRSTGPATQQAVDAGARVEIVAMSRSADWHNLAAPLFVRAIIRRLKPDLVHGHSSIGGVVARSATIGTGIPVLYTGHGLSRNPWALRAERALRHHYDRFIAVSAGEREFALQSGIADADQIVVIPNGIDDRESTESSEHRLRGMLDLSPTVPVIGSVARLAAQKAPDVFIAAAAIVKARRPDAHFVLIGYGPLQTDVERLALETGLGSNFHLIDKLANARDCLSEFDIFTLPSRFEGAPYSLLEAMRAGTPVVVTDVAGNRDAVRDGRTGLVVPPDDPAALADALLKLMDDDSLRERLASGARAALPQFDLASMVRATERVYGELRGATLSGHRRLADDMAWRNASA